MFMTDNGLPPPRRPRRFLSPWLVRIRPFTCLIVGFPATNFSRDIQAAVVPVPQFFGYHTNYFIVRRYHKKCRRDS